MNQIGQILHSFNRCMEQPAFTPEFLDAFNMEISKLVANGSVSVEQAQGIIDQVQGVLDVCTTML